MFKDRITRRKFLAKAMVLTGGLVGVGILAGCGATPTPTKPKAEPTKAATAAPTAAATKAVATAAPTAPAKGEKITLRVMTLGGVRGDKARKFCEMYAKNNPNVTVKNEDTSYGEMQMKTELLYGTNNLQDITYGHCSYAALGGHKGWYMQLDELLKTGAVPDYNDFYPALVENIKWQGKTFSIIDWAIPGSTTILFNRSLLKAKGVTPPSTELGALTVAEFAELAKKVTDKDKGIFGLTLDAGQTYRIENWSRCWGKPAYGPKGDTKGWIVSPDGKKFSFADNEFVKTWYNEIYRPLLEARAIPRTEDQIEGTLFYGGRQALQQGQVMWPRRTWLRVKDKWDYSVKDDWFMMPKGPEGRVGTASQTQDWHVSGQTKYPEESLKVIGFMTNRDAGLFEILEAESGYTGRASVFTDPKVVEYSPNYLATHKLLLSGNVEPSLPPANLRWAELDDAFRNLWNPLQEGKKTWDEQAPVIQKEGERIFALAII